MRVTGDIAEMLAWIYAIIALGFLAYVVTGIYNWNW